MTTHDSLAVSSLDSLPSTTHGMPPHPGSGSVGGVGKQQWLKYGEKNLSDGQTVRAYFKCSEKAKGGCQAKKMVDFIRHTHMVTQVQFKDPHNHPVSSDMLTTQASFITPHSRKITPKLSEHGSSPQPYPNTMPLRQVPVHPSPCQPGTSLPQNMNPALRASGCNPPLHPMAPYTPAQPSFQIGSATVPQMQHLGMAPESNHTVESGMGVAPRSGGKGSISMWLSQLVSSPKEMNHVMKSEGQTPYPPAPCHPTQPTPLLPAIPMLPPEHLGQGYNQIQVKQVQSTHVHVNHCQQAQSLFSGPPKGTTCLQPLPGGTQILCQQASKLPLTQDSGTQCPSLVSSTPSAAETPWCELSMGLPHSKHQQVDRGTCEKHHVKKDLEGANGLGLQSDTDLLIPLKLGLRSTSSGEWEKKNGPPVLDSSSRSSSSGSTSVVGAQDMRDLLFERIEGTKGEGRRDSTGSSSKRRMESDMAQRGETLKRMRVTESSGCTWLALNIEDIACSCESCYCEA